jgi:glycosyltransferase involved in cell wall biosynthesis
MISIIIPTYNSERPLVPTLSALVSGALAGMVSEVTIVDLGSTDDTAKVADEAGCTLFKTAKRGEGLSTAARSARTPWLFFISPGTVPSSNWIEEASRFVEMTNLMEKSSRAAVLRRAPPIDSRLPLLREALGFVASSLGTLPHPEQGLLIARTLYEEVGGHRADTADPERDLIRRIGRRRIVTLRSGAMTMGQKL